MNIQEILSYQRPKETYYDILGCDQSSSIEQINREYKIKALQLHPDKNPAPESLEKFRQLQEAKEVLSDEKTRRSYDHWLNSRIHIPFEQWQNRKGHSMHWAPPRSTKLSILEDISPRRQGSDEEFSKPVERLAKGGGVNWLDKFRNYEI